MVAATFDVVLRPFRELVKLAETASSCAADEPDHRNSQPLHAAARLLSNEGERALKKIAPLLLNPTPAFREFLHDLTLHQGTNDDAPI